MINPLHIEVPIKLLRWKITVQSPILKESECFFVWLWLRAKEKKGKKNKGEIYIAANRNCIANRNCYLILTIFYKCYKKLLIFNKLIQKRKQLSNQLTILKIIKGWQARLTMSDFENLNPCERAEIYNAAPHIPLGFLPVCK